MARITILRATLSLLIAALPTCGPDKSSTGGASEASSTKTAEYVVFHDRMDPKYEWVIVMGPEQTFLQKAVFPGYTDRQWYVLDEKHLADAICRQQGELSPPFVPDGPNLMRNDVLDDNVGTMRASYFRNENTTLTSALTKIETAATATKPLTQVPKWVSERKVAIRLLGL